MKDEELIKLTEELIAAPSCCQELKEAARGWLASVGTENRAAAATAFIKELEEDIIKLDDALAFFASPGAAKLFGEEAAGRMAAHMRGLKENGAEYCDCDACTKGIAILKAKEGLM